MTCDVCNKELEIGDFPFCGGNNDHGTAHAAIVRDEIPGGQVFENGFETPQKFYSHSEHRKALAARGLEIRAKYAGPADKHLTNWAVGAVDLAGAEAFVRRYYTPTPVEDPIPITVTTITFEREP